MYSTDMVIEVYPWLLLDVILYNKPFSFTSIHKSTFEITILAKRVKYLIHPGEISGI